MLLVIHNLPITSKYIDIKTLIKSKCGITEVILDNLVNEGFTKKVTVGLADEGDAAILARKINGLYLNGQQLYVEHSKQKKESEQPYRSSRSLLQQPELYDPFAASSSDPRDAQMSQTSQYVDQNMLYQNQESMMTGYNMGMGGTASAFYNLPVQVMPVQVLPQLQNSITGYGHQQNMAPLISQAPEVHAQQDRFGFRAENVEESRWDQIRRPDNRRPSPPRGHREGYQQPAPRWDMNELDGQGGARRRRRSRSPVPRGQWDSDNRQQPFQEPFPRRNHYNDEPAPQQSIGYPQSLSTSFAGLGALLQTPGTQPARYEQPSHSGWDQTLSSRRDQPPTSKWDQMAVPRRDDPAGREQPRASKWNPPSHNQSQYGRDSFQPQNNLREEFQPQNSRRDMPSNRGGRNLPPRDNTRSFEPRKDRGGPGPSRQPREEFRAPKRPIRGKDNDEPQAKRFATPRGAPSDDRNRNGPPQKPFQSKFGPKGPQNASPQKPFQPKFGPRNPQNASPQRPFQPKFGPRNPQNAPNIRERKPGPETTPNPPETLEKRIIRDETWRGQASSAIAKTVLKFLQVDIKPGDKIFGHLKRSIRARINVMLGDQIDNRPGNIMLEYEKKYPPSSYQEFFTTVVKDLKEQQAKEINEASEELKKVVANQGSPSKAEGKQVVKTVPAKPKPEAATPKAPRTSTVPKKLGNLPKFPEGDKLTHKRTKADQKKDWNDENYDLSDPQKKALDEEVDTLCDIFMGECMNPENDMEKNVCEEIADVVSDEFRKIVRIHLSRRILNISKNLIIRVHTPKRPTEKLANYLNKLGCIALQKSDRSGQLSLAYFDSFEAYDKVIALGSAVIDGVTVTFKPLQICGPPPSAAIVRQQHIEKRNKFIQSQIDKSKENILQPGYVYNMTKEDKTENSEENNEVNENDTGEGEAKPTDEKDAEAESWDEPWDDNETTQQNGEGNADVSAENADVPDNDDVDEDDLEDY